MEHLILEREAEVKELEAAYPEPIKRLTRLFHGRKCHVVKEGEIVYESSVRAQDLATHYVELALNNAECRAFAGTSGIDAHEAFSKEESGWAGLGSVQLAREY